MNDLLMTKDGDLAVRDNDIQTTDSIIQAINIRLKWFFSEWRYGPDYGVKYFENIFVKNPKKQVIISEISNQILDVDGVASVDSVTLEINNSTRTALIKYTITTESMERYEKEVDVWNTV